MDIKILRNTRDNQRKLLAGKEYKVDDKKLKKKLKNKVI